MSYPGIMTLVQYLVLDMVLGTGCYHVSGHSGHIGQMAGHNERIKLTIIVTDPIVTIVTATLIGVYPCNQQHYYNIILISSPDRGQGGVKINIVSIELIAFILHIYITKKLLYRLLGWV